MELGGFIDHIGGWARRASRLVIGSELLIWAIIAGMVSYPAIMLFLDSLDHTDSIVIAISRAADRAPLSIVAGTLTLLFPILVAQIFGMTPFALLRRRFNRVFYVQLESDTSSVSPSEIDSPVLHRARDIINADPRTLLALYAERSSDLTQRIYGRAGVYLLVGVLIAFVGLGFFWARSREVTPNADYVEHFLNLMPGFGILFFIEFVAFFFLRQYRAAMDEFRYFDAIRRSREESLIVLKMFAENKTEVSTRDVLAAMSIYSGAGRLGKDETTDILESRRLQRDELIIFEKLVDMFGTLKEMRKGEDKKK